jgi:hypothetical protein
VDIELTKKELIKICLLFKQGVFKGAIENEKLPYCHDFPPAGAYQAFTSDFQGIEL